LESDERFMREALAEAQEAFAKEEVPVGAVLVYQGRVVARAHNLVESRRDATAHAELLCLQMGAEVLGNWRLVGATLYCTLEPCPMCAGAMIHSRLERLVWGAPDLRCGAHGSWVNILDAGHPIHQMLVASGVMKEECAALMRVFFKQRRMKKVDGEVMRKCSDALPGFELAEAADFSSEYLRLFDELIEGQRKKLLNFARESFPHFTSDDLLQPNDFPKLEHDPLFRYEEGILEGLLTARMAYLAMKKELLFKRI